MLQSNNPDVDMQEVAQKARHIAEYRRRSVPLFISTAAGAESMLIHQNSALGRLSLLPVIGALVRSGENAWRRVSQPGLTAKQRVRLLPGVGAVAGWFYSLLIINRIRARMEDDLAALRQADLATDGALMHLSHQVNHLAALLQLQTERAESASSALTQLNERQRRDSEALQERMARLEQEAVLHRESYSRLAALQQAVRRIADRPIAPAIAAGGSATAGATAGSSALATPAVGDAAPFHLDMGSFYIEFENNFRGSRAEIKERLALAYRPYLLPYAGDPSARAVDVGSGRGEWLELMRDNDIAAVGVDLDRDMVDACLELGFDAVHQDAVQYLLRQPEGSVAIISGFHIIEHLPFDVLVGLFDAALHALRPDGMIIFETPNPENIVVGACNFYYDPTHLNPIVPHVAEFMARQRGFARAEILRLHPYPKEMQIAEESEMARRFNQLIYGPQDFAVLGWKSHAK